MAEIARAMKVIYIHQYFRTPEQGGAVRSYHLAKGLIQAGIDVELITAHPHGEYDQRWIDGIKVHYLPVAYDQKFGFFRRIWSFLQFVRLGKKLLKKLSRPDLLYITSTPLTTGWIGLWAKKTLALPYIFEVRDLWPEAPIQVGAIRNRLLIRFLRGMEKKIYDQALSLVALSPGIARHLSKISPDRSVALIPNFSDLDLFFPKEKSGYLSSKLRLSPGLTIAYAGALGKVNAVEELLELAKLALQLGKNWNFLIMGEGSHRAYLQQKAQNLALSNTRFLPFGPKTQVNELLSVADFAWISFAHLPVLKTNSPNKFFDAISSGKAILVNHKGWVHQLVKTHDIGFAFLPGKWTKALNRLEALENQPQEILNMGKRARKLAETRFSKELAIARVLEIIRPNSSPTPADAVDIRTA
jgi:glycosyltransferase involved in cell wall biosynthesis